MNTFQEKLQNVLTANNKQRPLLKADRVTKAAQEIYDQWCLPAAQRDEIFTLVPWTVFMQKMGDNHGHADALVTYLTQTEGLKLTNAVPSGDVIRVQWSRLKPTPMERLQER